MKHLLLLAIIFGHTLGGVAFADPLIDIRDALHGWYSENKELGDVENLPKGIIHGDIYTYTYALAQLQVAHPALEALDLTYQSIANRCDGKDLLPRDITNVFARLPAGLNLRYLLEAKQVVSDIQDATFNNSCKAVYKCFNRASLEELLGDDLDTWDLFTDEVNMTCRTIVDDVFVVMYERTRTLQSMKNINYGDELLANAKHEDGPFDLLLDVGAIGNILFTHNDPPAEIHFYTMEPLGGYVFNDPDTLTPYEEEDPEDKERTDRFPPTLGDVPSMPDEEVNIYPPPLFVPQFDDASPANLVPTTTVLSDGSLGSAPEDLPSNSVLGNVFCEESIDFGEATDPILERAVEENSQTAIYNRKLDLDDEIAVALGAKLSPELEQGYGLTFRGAGGESLDLSPPAKEEAENIVEELIDLGGETLDEMKSKIQQCVAEFTNENTDAWGKVLFKSITQPAEFTKCVFGHLCREISDPSGRGFFHIKICRELRKGNGLISVQPVKAVEEIVDELLNICTTMKESGALLEHNKTKDHLEHKLMRLKLGNKFAFGISVIFASPEDAVDPGVAKARAIERREYLEGLQLGFSDDLSFVVERNKYLVLQDKRATRIGFAANNITAQTNQLKVEKNDPTNPINSDGDLEETSTLSSFNDRGLKSQLLSNATTIGAYQQFVLENIEMWDVINQYTDSMNKKRKTTLSRFQASPGK